MQIGISLGRHMVNATQRDAVIRRLRSALVPGWHRIGQRSRSLILRPYQLVLAVLPLIHRLEIFTIASAIRLELHGPHDSHHVGRSDGIAYLVPVQGAGARESVGQYLDA